MRSMATARKGKKQEWSKFAFEFKYAACIPLLFVCTSIGLSLIEWTQIFYRRWNNQSDFAVHFIWNCILCAVLVNRSERKTGLEATNVWVKAMGMEWKRWAWSESGRTKEIARKIERERWGREREEETEREKGRKNEIQRKDEKQGKRQEKKRKSAKKVNNISYSD